MKTILRGIKGLMSLINIIAWIVGVCIIGNAFYEFVAVDSAKMAAAGDVDGLGMTASVIVIGIIVCGIVIGITSGIKNAISDWLDD